MARSCPARPARPAARRRNHPARPSATLHRTLAAKASVREELSKLRHDAATLSNQHAQVSQRLADDRAEVRQLAAERSHLNHQVALAREELQRNALQVDTSRREVDHLRQEYQVCLCCACPRARPHPRPRCCSVVVCARACARVCRCCCVVIIRVADVMCSEDHHTASQSERGLAAAQCAAYRVRVSHLLSELLPAVCLIDGGR
jgi:hypothetical protein